MSTSKKLNPILRQKQADRKQKAAEYAAFSGTNFAGIVAELASQTVEAIRKDSTKTGTQKDKLITRLDAAIVQSLSAIPSPESVPEASQSASPDSIKT